MPVNPLLLAAQVARLERTIDHLLTLERELRDRITALSAVLDTAFSETYDALNAIEEVRRELPAPARTFTVVVTSVRQKPRH